MKASTALRSVSAGCSLRHIAGLALAILIASLPSGTALAAGAIPFVKATAENPDGRSFDIDWDAPVDHVSVLASTDLRAFPATPIGSGGGKGNITVTLPTAPRWYFKLIPDRGDSLVIADRSLHLSSAANFRDVGGYRTTDGHWVKMGVAYRSNALNMLSPQDTATAEALDIKLVCDLRMDEEQARAPDPVVGRATKISDNVLADRTSASAKSDAPFASSASEAADRVKQAYRDFVDLPSARRGYHDLFERLSDPANLPTVFHCTAGKDRTGWAQAVLLTILGVPRDVIIQDYQLTDRYLASQMAEVENTLKPGTSPDVAKTMLRADPAYLDAAFQEVTARYGTFENYLHKGLDLDDKTIASIRQSFL